MLIITYRIPLDHHLCLASSSATSLFSEAHGQHYARGHGRLSWSVLMVCPGASPPGMTQVLNRLQIIGHDLLFFFRAITVDSLLTLCSVFKTLPRPQYDADLFHHPLPLLHIFLIPSHILFLYLFPFHPHFSCSSNSTAACRGSFLNKNSDQDVLVTLPCGSPINPAHVRQHDCAGATVWLAFLKVQ